VVYDGVQPERRDCQFSFACDGTLRRPRDAGAWRRVRVLAERIMTGDVKLSGITRYATAYHSVDVAPAWAESMVKTVQIGNHVFYKRDPFGQARLVQAIVKPIDSIAGFFSQASMMPVAAAAPSEEIQPQVQIPDAVGNGA
jgi:hypothetical protein